MTHPFHPTAYGHGGYADGYENGAAITTDGRAVTVVITAALLPDEPNFGTCRQNIDRIR